MVNEMKYDNGPAPTWTDGFDLVEELEGEKREVSTTQDSSFSGSEEMKQHSVNVEKAAKRTLLVAFLTVLMGTVVGCSFLYFGIKAAKDDEADRFERRASDTAKEIESSWDDYEAATRWVHESCRNWREDNMTYHDFEILYKYITSSGLEFDLLDWVPNITHDERPQIEADIAKIPGLLNFNGLTGQEPDPDNPGKLKPQPRSNQSFYFPLYFAEPRANAKKATGYDLWSPPWEKPAIMTAFATYKPALTGRFKLTVAEVGDNGYSVVLYHPGAHLPDVNITAKDLSAMVININKLMLRAARAPSDSLSVYLFDFTTHMDNPEEPPQFLSGLEIHADSQSDTDVQITAETEYAGVRASGSLYFEQDMLIGGKIWTIVVVPIDGDYEPNLTSIILCGTMIILGSLLLAIWMMHNTRRSIQMHRVITKAAAEASIVADLFPPNVRERMIKDKEAKALNSSASPSKDVFLRDGKGAQKLSEDRLNDFLTSEGIFGSKPIAELHPYCTIMFADIQGFTAWSSVREPSQVFTLLEIMYNSFDNIAKRRRVFKVETVGDCYVAVAGLPQPRRDHAVVIGRFAFDCLDRFQKLVKALEKTLGPDTADLGCRLGIHSGQVTAGVLRGDKGRFQLFGDSVNMASRMESSGVRNKIQVSQETADLLELAGRGKWLIPREEAVQVKGKGKMTTFFLVKVDGSKASIMSETLDIEEQCPVDGAHDALDTTDDKIGRLVEWNVEELCNLLKRIVARRGATKNVQATGGLNPSDVTIDVGDTVLDEVKTIITLPPFNEKAVREQIDPASIKLDPEVVAQLTSLVRDIASMYNANPFHSFEHASHVTMSVLKMMSRIVDPKEISAKKKSGNYQDKGELEADLHDHTFGITSDPLTQFACAFSAIIHDLDHQGVPNTTLIQEGYPLAAKYKKSIAEQNSVDLAWDLLMNPRYDQLRACICANEEEFARFRSLVVNSVMATDIMDKELGANRKARWNKAFSEDNEDAEPPQDVINRKATIVIEHLIQASDVSHTMQHWHIYVKWNERLFHEMYKAYKEGRIEKDPAPGWHKGEMGFFDFYIIPLAKKLFTCGVFGVSSDEFLNYALINRKEWEQKGALMVEEYVQNYHKNFEN